MFGQQRDERRLVVHSGGRRGKNEEEVSLDPTELEDSAKFVLLADLPLSDARNRLRMERQDLAGLDRVLAGEVPDVEEVTPCIGIDLFDGAPNIPWHAPEASRIQTRDQVGTGRICCLANR